MNGIECVYKNIQEDEDLAWAGYGALHNWEDVNRSTPRPNKTFGRM